MAAIAKSFDYSEVSKEQKSKLVYFAGQLKAAKLKFVKSILELGEIIAGAHEVIEDGQFSRWVESECGVARQTAYNYMNAYRAFSGCPIIGQLDDTAIYALSSPKTPEPARKEAIKLADKGQHISLAVAREIIAKHAPQPEPEPEPEPEPPAADHVPRAAAKGTEPDPASFYQTGGDDEPEIEADDEPTELAIEEPSRPSESRKALKAAQDCFLALSAAERISFRDWLEGIVE